MKVKANLGMLACVVFMGGCVAATEGEAEGEEALGEVSESLVGGLRLGVFDNGSWYVDWNGDAVHQAGEKFATFGEPNDFPLVGIGGPYLCGTSALHVIGTFRRETNQYFIDSNATMKWDAGDTAVSGFGIAESLPYVWATPFPNFAGRCRGVIGWMVAYDPGKSVWFIDANNDRALSTWNVPGGDLRYEFVVPPGALWPVPMWSAAHQSTIMAVFNRTDGTWYIDKNNNKRFDGCVLDTCQFWGMAHDIPFGNTNLPHRAVSRWTTFQGILGMHKLIDGNANGIWDPPNDAAYSYLPQTFRAFLL